MALNPISDLLQGIKRLYVGLQGVKSDGVTMETIKTNDAGALKVSAELTGSLPSLSAGTNNIGQVGTVPQEPTAMIISEIAAGATGYSTKVIIQGFSEIGVGVNCQQTYDLYVYAGSALLSSLTKAADVATSQAATGATGEKYYRVTNYVSGAKQMQIGIRNTGMSAVTPSVSWMGHK